MRIVYFTDTYFPEVNGVANTLSVLHSYLEQYKIEHLFFTPDYNKENQAQESDVVRYQGFAVPFSPNSRFAVTLPFHRAIKKQVRNFDPDLIHITTEFSMGNEGLRIAKELNIPVVMSYHTNIDQYLEYFHAQLLEKPIRSYFKKFHSYARLNLCPSHQTLKQLKKQGYKHLKIWSRGVDSWKFSPSKRTGEWREKLHAEGKFICLYVGRLSNEKGIDYLIDAITGLSSKYADSMMFVFAGDGPYREKIECAGLANVVLTGFVRGEELARLYADSDAFVFPSGTETFGNVLLEAMASGLPCICADKGGVTDFTENEKNALVVPYKDSKAIKHAIKRLFNQEDLRKKLIHGALKTAEKRSWNSIMDGLIKDYERVVE